jgi:hypothetical protein
MMRKRSGCLLRLLVQRVLPAPLAVLLHLQTRLQDLLVLLRVVVHVLAHCALEVNQIILGHRGVLL